MSFQIISIVFLFALFGFLHSLLASKIVKEKLIVILKEKIAFYRIFYNIFSVLTFAIFIIVSPNINEIVYKVREPLSYLMIIPFLVGLYGIIISSKYFSLSEFLGISQVKRYLNKTYSLNDLDEKMTLRISGPYKFMRHPIYFFSIIMILSIPEMTVSRLVIVVCIIFYFYVGSIYEEKKLVKKFGDEYIEYQKNVPRIFPRIKL